MVRGMIRALQGKKKRRNYIGYVLLFAVGVFGSGLALLGAWSSDRIFVLFCLEGLSFLHQRKWKVEKTCFWLGVRLIT